MSDVSMNLTPAAIDAWRDAIARNTRANYEYHMARALVGQGERALGESRLRRCLDIDPAYHFGRCFLIDHLRSEGRTAEADAVERDGVARFPDFATAQALFRASEQIEAGNFEGVEPLLKNASAYWREEVLECWRQILDRQQIKGAPPAELLASAGHVLEIDPKAPGALTVAAMNSLLLGGHAAAVGYFDRLAEVAPDRLDALLFSGIARHCDHDFSGALACFDRLLQHESIAEPRNAHFYAKALAHQSGTLLALGDAAAADQAARQALAADANDFRPEAFIALIRWRQGRPDEAAAAAAAALRKSPEHSFALIILAASQTNLGQNDEALKTVMRLKNSPSYVVSTMLDIAFWAIPIIAPLAERIGLDLRQVNAPGASSTAKINHDAKVLS